MLSIVTFTSEMFSDESKLILTDNGTTHTILKNLDFFKFPGGVSNCEMGSILTL